MKVAIQGEAGSNSQLATRALVGDAELLPCTLSEEVFERLTRSHDADAAVLPIENSLHGAVADHSDLLLRYDVAIVGELSLRIRHALIAARGVRVEDVQRVFSHPVALSQCRRFFAAHPRLQAVPFYDTAGAVKHVVEAHMPAAAAIAAPYAAEMYGGQILQGDLEDDPLNFTRFFLLTRTADAARIRPAAAEINKMSLAFDLPHRPGSLREALTLLHEEGADLTRIESRPVPGRPWEYLFFVDLRVSSSTAADAVLRHLGSICHMVKEFGRYTAAAPPEPAVVSPAPESSIPGLW
ncbi:MAG: prephenate dehydratase [Janthinobacterium lividum]